MTVRRAAAALLAPFVLLAGGEAEGQSSSDRDRNPVVGMKLDAVPDNRAEADLAVRGMSGQDIAAGNDGLLRSWDLNGDAVLGVGRFSISKLPRPRTYMEEDETPTSVRPTDSGIAAVGVKVPF